MSPQVGELGAGRKGEIKLMKHIRSKELVAVKYIARVVSLPAQMSLTTMLRIRHAEHPRAACAGWRGAQQEH